MFFYFVFFRARVAALLAASKDRVRRRARGCGRLKASEKYFGKIVDSKKNRD